LKPDVNRLARSRTRVDTHCEYIYISDVPRPTPTSRAGRSKTIEAVASRLVPAASRVTRLVSRRAPQRISRSEAGLLAALSVRPRRITELADFEGHAQPTITLLVKRMEERGWVARERDRDDGRVVLVSLTEAGTAAFEDIRATYRAVLHDHLATMTDAEIAALMTATTALEALIDALQPGGTE
jgi:DNA-binding MarR family transcriptional regulator